MPSIIGHAVSLFAAPALALCAAALASARPGLLPPDMVDASGVAPFALAALGAVLCWRFKRSRGVFVLGLVALGHWLGSSLFTLSFEAGLHARLAYAAFGLLFPVNVLVISLAGDRGVLTSRGLVIIGAAALQAAVAAAFISGGFGLPGPETAVDMQLWARDVLDAEFFNGSIWGWSISGLTPIPQPALAALVLATLAICALALAKNRPMDAGLAGTVAAVGLGLHSMGPGPASALYFTAATMVPVLTVFQDSYRMAFMDELTGLPGRRALNADLKNLGGGYALAMADVDHFKKFNDTYGHDTGDDVLRLVASRLARAEGGTAYRYGGEEFTIVFPRLDAEQALARLDAVRLDVAGSGFVVRAPRKGKNKKPGSTGKTVNVTVSMGVAVPGKDAATAAQVLKSADKALYKAKRGGRNKVVAA